MKYSIKYCILFAIPVILILIACNPKVPIIKIPLPSSFMVKQRLQEKIDKDVYLVMHENLVDLIVTERLTSRDFIFIAGISIQNMMMDALQSIFQRVHFSNVLPEETKGVDYFIVLNLKGYNIRTGKALMGAHVVHLCIEFSLLKASKQIVFIKEYDGFGIEGLFTSKSGEIVINQTVTDSGQNVVKALLKDDISASTLKFVNVNKMVSLQMAANSAFYAVLDGSVNAMAEAWLYVQTMSIAQFLISLENYLYFGKLPTAKGKINLKEPLSVQDYSSELLTDYDAILGLINSKNCLTKILVARLIYEKYSNFPEIIDGVHTVLLNEYMEGSDDKLHAKAMVWLCYVLGNSRDDKYINTLVKIAQTAEDKGIRKGAKKTLSNYYDIKKHYENFITEKMEDTGSISFIQYPREEIAWIKLLNSRDTELKYYTSLYRLKHYPSNTEISDAVEEILTMENWRNPLNKYHEISLAYMCAILGNSEDIRYASLLEKIATEAESKAICKIASKALKNVTSD